MQSLVDGTLGGDLGVGVILKIRLILGTHKQHNATMMPFKKRLSHSNFQKVFFK